MSTTDTSPSYGETIKLHETASAFESDSDDDYDRLEMMIQYHKKPINDEEDTVPPTAQSEATTRLPIIKKVVDNNPKINLIEQARTQAPTTPCDLTFSLGPKTGHPLAKYNESDKSLYVNGRNGLMLYLRRGETYYLKVEQDLTTPYKDRFCLVITDNPSGGDKSTIMGFTPITTGVGSLTIDQNAPRLFYYQDASRRNAGGPIYVID